MVHLIIVLVWLNVIEGSIMIHHKFIQLSFFLFDEQGFLRETVLQGQAFCLLGQRKHVLVNSRLYCWNLLISYLVLEILSDNVYHILHVIEHRLVVASICACCLIDITAHVKASWPNIDVHQLTFNWRIAFGFLIRSEETFSKIFIVRFSFSASCRIIKGLAYLILIELVEIYTLFRLGRLKFYWIDLLIGLLFDWHLLLHLSALKVLAVIECW